MALVDAGVPLKDTVVSCTASLVKDVPLVDVNHVEQSGGSPELVVSILPNSGEVKLILTFDLVYLANYTCVLFNRGFQIVYMSLTQRFHIDHLSKVLDTAIKGCKDIGAILNEIMKGHLTKLDTSLQAS
jgi:exosome complex component RRP41